jgi:hypothetical protein
MMKMMKKNEIIEKLKATCASLIESIQNSTEEEFYLSKNGKWSAAQNFGHLTFSTKIMNRAFSAPKIALWYKFGRRFKGESRAYETIVSIYEEANSKPRQQATGFEPRMKPDSTKAFEIQAFKKIHEELFQNLERWSESQINSYLVPHPLIGKLTIKEMLYFVDYHILHHQKAVEIAVS